MEKYLYLIVPMLILLGTQGAHGSGYLVPLGQGITVQKYHMHGGGGMTLWVSGINNPDNCTGTDKVHIRGNLTGYNQMAAAVMAAYISGKKIGLWSTGCSVIPFWGGATTYPIINDLWVTD